MSDARWIERPAVLVQIGHRLEVVLFDEAEVERAALEAQLRSGVRLRQLEGTTALLSQDHTNLDTADLSPLYLRDADEDGLWSMIDEIDNYLELHSVTSARRDGERVTLEVFVKLMPEGQGAYGLGPDDVLEDEVSCEIGAFRAALDDATRRIDDVAQELEDVRLASEETERGVWLAWANHPQHIVREAVIGAPHAHDDALLALAERDGHAWRLIRRGRLPARAVELVYETRYRKLPELAIAHADASDALLERAILDARGAGRHDASTRAAAKAHALLAERKLAAGADLDDAFGDLRSLLEATPSEATGVAVFKALEAAIEREPGRVAERWVPYAREHMRGWERADCTLPLDLVTRWVRHRTISAAWGVARVIGFQRHVAGAPESAWRVFGDSPHLGAAESLGVRHQVDEHALSCIARASLPSLTHLTMVHWGQPTSAPDASALAHAAWVPQLQHIMLGSYALSPEALATLLSRAPRLEWLSLFDVDFDASHVQALVESGAHESLEYLSLNNADCADGLEALARTNTPKLKNIQLHGVQLTDGQLRVLQDSQPSGAGVSHS